MKFSGPFIRRLFWRPNGCCPSLRSLNESPAIGSKTDVTVPVSGEGSARHPLIVVELFGGKVIGDARVVATRDDMVVDGLQGLFGSDLSQNHYLLRRRRLRIPCRRRGTALLLGAANSDNYYHWLLDSLPRWKLLQEAGFLDYDYVLLHSRRCGFQDETLDRLRIPPEKRLRCSKNFVHQFDRLIVPAMPFPVEEVTPWACAWVRSLFPERSSGAERLFLSRRGVKSRHLANEIELESSLKHLGFLSLQPELLSVTEQANIFSSARWVVAPHGASLTNLLFAPPGARLVELFHPHHKNRCYMNLAAACGHRYATLEGQPTDRSKKGYLEYEIEIPALLKILANEFSLPSAAFTDRGRPAKSIATS